MLAFWITEMNATALVGAIQPGLVDHLRRLDYQDRN
jgi:hypothetical protein